MLIASCKQDSDKRFRRGSCTANQSRWQFSAGEKKMACLFRVASVFVLAGLCAASAGAILHETMRLTTFWSLRNLRFLQTNPILDDSIFAHARLREEVVAI